MSVGKEASRKVFFEKLYTYPQKQVQNHLLATEMGFAVTSEVCLSNTFFQGWCGYNNNRSDEDESCINWDITGTTLWELIGTYRVCVCVCVCLFAQPARLLCPWGSPGKNTGVGRHFLLQRIFQTQGSNRHLLQADSFCLSHQGSSCGRFMSAIAAMINSTPLNTLNIKGNIFKGQV